MTTETGPYHQRLTHETVGRNLGRPVYTQDRSDMSGHWNGESGSPSGSVRETISSLNTDTPKWSTDHGHCDHVVGSFSQWPVSQSSGPKPSTVDSEFILMKKSPSHVFIFLVSLNTKHVSKVSINNIRNKDGLWWGRTANVITCTVFREGSTSIFPQS